MRRFIICIFVLGIAVSSLATAYEGDVIYIDGEQWTLMGQPVERDSAILHHLKDVLPAKLDWGSANWNGYRGYWTILDGRLYLDSIMIGVNQSSSFLPADDMLKVFHGYYVDGRILASWITGEVRVARGHVVKYVHQGYLRRMEYEQHYTIDQGCVTDCVAYHNRVVVGDSWMNDLGNMNNLKTFEKYQYMIPIPVENYPELAGIKEVDVDVSDIQVDTLGNLLDCSVKIDFKGDNDELKDRLSQDVKAALMNLRPWKVLFINNEYVTDIENFWFRYDLEQ